MATTSQCPETNLLQALLDGHLTEEAQASLESHLKTCESCRARLDELTGRMDLLPDAARKEVSQEPRGDSGLQRAVERLRAQGPSGGDCSAESPTEAEERCVAGLSLDFLDPPTQPQSVGQLGRYEITGVIGQGGMGVVLKARDPALNRVVAIKVLSPHFASSATAGKRFTREAQMAAAVSHDHVVTIHAVDAAKGLPFLVMEYIAGVSLEERIRRTGPLKVEEILRIGMQAASGLAAAHAQGLVHRDIKPSNILLENGVERVKITDFGLARVVHEAKITQTGVVAGTPEYMSPEQARGEDIDRRSDLFSLGCVLYAMCTGRSPFRATTVTGAIHRVCEDTPRPIRETNPDIPDWLTGIIDRLLAKKPDDRFQTAGELADVLGQYLAYVQQPSQVSRPRSLPRLEAECLSQPLRQRSFSTLAVRAGAVLCAVLLLGGSIWIWKQMHPSNASTPASRIDTGADLGLGPTSEQSRPGGAEVEHGGKRFLLVDCQNIANFDLSQQTDQPGNDLSQLEPGIASIAGVPFQFGEKYIRLSGMNMNQCPERVRDIVVGARVDRLDFLHGAQYAGKDEGVQLCQFEVRYEDGSAEVIPVLVGADVWDWWRPLPSHPDRGEIAWMGANPLSTARNMLLVLFRKTWVNPRPDAKISTIGYSKAPQTPASPFCVAITAQLAREAPSGVSVGRLHVNLDWTTLQLVLRGGPMPMTFFGGKSGFMAYDLEPGSYAAQIIQKTPTEDIVIREGMINIAPGTNVWVYRRDGSASCSVAETQPTPADELPSAASVFDVAYSPVASRLLTTHYDGLARLWKLTRAGHDEPVVLRAHKDRVRRGSFSHDGRLILLGSDDGTFTIWDADKDKLLRTVKAHEGALRALSFTRDGKRVLSAAIDQPYVKIWDARSGDLESEFLAHDEGVAQLVFSRDGRMLATSGAKDGKCIVWEAESWQKRFSVAASSGNVAVIAFAPEGTSIATGGSEGTVRLWDTADGRLIRTFSVKGAIQNLAFLSDGRTLAVGDGDGQVSTWDVASGSLQRSFFAHWCAVAGMAISPDGSRLATGSWDATTRIWDLTGIAATSEPLGPQPEFVFTDLKGTPGAAVAFSPTRNTLIAAHIWGKLVRFDLDQCRKSSSVEGLGFIPLGALQFANNGEKAVVCLNAKEVQFYDAQTLSLWGTVATGGKPTCAAFFPDGKSIVVTHWPARVIERWDVEPARRRWSCPSRLGKPGRPVVSPDGLTVAVETSNGPILLLDAETGKPLREPLLHGGDKQVSTRFSPDGKLLASAGEKLIKLWDTSTFREIATFSGHAGQTTSVAFSRDGMYMVTSDVGNWDEYFTKTMKAQHGGTIILWDLQSRKPLLEFAAHNGAIACVDFSRDGKRIASTGRDGRVCVWNVDELLKFPFQPGKVAAATHRGIK